MNKKYWNIIGSIVGILIIVLMIRKFMIVYNKIDWQIVHFSVLKVILSVLIFVGAYFVDVFAWKKILGRLNIKVAYLKAFVVLSFANMGKYIPGKIFTVIGRVAIDTDKKREVVFSVFIEMFFLSLSAFIISLFIISGMWNIDIKILIIIAILSLFGVHPIIINFVLKNILKRKEYEWQSGMMANIVLLFVYLFSWILKGFSFYLMVRSFVYTDNVWYVISVFPLSWMIGFFAIIVPGGIGVREGIMSVALSRILEESLSIGISLFSRLWIMIIEILSLIISFIIWGIRKDSLWG